MSRIPTNPGPYGMHNVPGGRRTYVIACSNCDATAEKVNQNFGPSSAREMLPKKFGEMGWRVHSHKRRHLCPNCFTPPSLKTLEPSKESPEAMANPSPLPVSHLRVPTSLTETVDPAPAAPALARVAPVVPTAPAAPVETPIELKTVAETPREPSMLEKRIITEKLGEFYGNDCYTAGWSDERLAKDLGVPRAWVAQVRDFSFGPDIDETASAAETAADKALKYAEKAHADLSELVERVTGDMRERLAVATELLADAKRLVALRKSAR